MPPLLERAGHTPHGARPVIGLVIESVDWHACELIAALRVHDVETVPVRLTKCGFATQSATGLHVDGFDGTLPDGLIVRTVSGGTFEAVTLRLGVLHALRELGVPVWNDARAIERCVDKSMTSFLLARAGIATPATWTTESYDEARAIVQRQAADGPLVLKPLFGSQGRGLMLIRTPDDLPQTEQAAGRVFYLQRFIGVERGGYHDFRVLVVRDRVVAAMQRHSSHWITNIKRGGRPVAVALNDELKTLALRAAAAVGAAFVGVDIIYDAAQRPIVLEVNSMPAWSGLQKVTAIHIASVFADCFMESIGIRKARGATA
jgi:tetrahydromethanopterin:alpha-L-glutamate ligase